MFFCEDASWTMTASDLGDTVGTYVQDLGEGSYRLCPYLDEDMVKKILLTHVTASFDSSTAAITFSKDSSGEIVVHSQAVGEMPQAAESVERLNETLFKTYCETGQATTFDGMPSAQIAMADIPDTMTFDDALSYGVVSQIETFTTEYTTRTEARTSNIHLASDMLNNTIVTANGGTWDFNDITGERTEEKGFEVAGVVVGNTHSEDVGGGICQVATTVFNAVYEAGFPVLQRHNHSIYISAYPAGRDAAVSWKTPDLQWKNDSSSDVLVSMTYTDDTVTCTLYGVDPNYKVETKTGEWKEGAAYGTSYEYDSTMSSGTQYVKSAGSNGRSITVVRTVTDQDGNVLHEDEFDSNYSATNQVIVKGTA